MYCLSWNSYKNSICNGFAQLQQDEEFVDMTLVAEGHTVKVHKNLISLASPFIKNIIKSVPCTHPILFLANITHDMLQLLLEYIYTGEVYVQIEKLSDFIKAANELRLPGISYDLSQAKGLTENTPDDSCSISIGENTKLLKERPHQCKPSEAVINSGNNDVINTNELLLPNCNNDQNLSHNLNSENMNTASKLFPINENKKIKTLDNRMVNLETSEAVISSPNDLQSDIEMTSSESANNRNVALATIPMNNQTSDTPEILSTGNNIQLFDSRLPGHRTRDIVIPINNSSHVLETSVLSQQEVDGNHDYMLPVQYVKPNDTNNFDDLLKVCAQQNSIENNSIAQQEQDTSYHDDSEMPFEYSVDIGTGVLPQEYTVSYRGSVQMILNRYLYSVQYSANGGTKRRWRCIDYRLKHCRAYVDTVDDKITNRKNCHTHPYHDLRIMKKMKANLVFQSLSKALLETKKRNNMEDKVRDIDSE